MVPLYDTLRPRRFPFVNWMLILLNAIVFYYELKLGKAGLNRFVNTWGLVPSHLASDPAAAWVTIFTSMFLHGGWFHILSNMWVLVIFGDNIEDRMGVISSFIYWAAQPPRYCKRIFLLQATCR